MNSFRDLRFAQYWPFLLFLAGMGYCGCIEQPAKDEIKKESEKAVVQTIKKPGSTFQDTLDLQGNVVVIFNPDSLQRLKIKDQNKPLVFENLEHDNFFQMRNARNTFASQWPKLKIAETNKARYLKFIKNDNSITIIDLDTINDIGGIILFNGVKAPQLVDMMNIETELNFYFNQ